MTSMNRLHNVGNPYQGKSKRVLCICSAGLLRSPTAAYVLQQEYGYNTRSAGSSKEYALIPVDEALIAWADELVFANQENFDEVCANFMEAIGRYNTPYQVLGLPDCFPYGDPELEKAILEAYKV